MGDTNEVSPEHAEKIAAKMIAADLGAGKRSVISLKKRRLPCLIFRIQGHEVFLHQRLEQR